jgi:hypothetical protein
VNLRAGGKDDLSVAPGVGVKHEQQAGPSEAPDHALEAIMVVHVTVRQHDRAQTTDLDTENVEVVKRSRAAQPGELIAPFLPRGRWGTQPPRSPRLNGQVEQAHRGHQEESYRSWATSLTLTGAHKHVTNDPKGDHYGASRVRRTAMHLSLAEAELTFA